MSRLTEYLADDDGAYAEEFGRQVAQELAEAEKQEPMLQFFAFGHLPMPLRVMSMQFAMLATAVVEDAPRSAERTVALRKLLEGKDAAVRAVLFKPPTVQNFPPSPRGGFVADPGPPPQHFVPSKPSQD